MAHSSEGRQEGDLSPELIAALRDVPRGAFALSGAVVLLLLLAWLAIYAFVFLPRGVVG